MRALWLSGGKEIIKTKRFIYNQNSCSPENHKDNTTMRLLDLFQEVKEESLTKDQLEDYRNELSGLYSMMQIELGQVKKRKAMFMGVNPEESNALRLRKWSATEDGLREIELKSYIRATSPILSSLRDRLYQVY